MSDGIQRHVPSRFERIESAVWEALEPHVEAVIDLDLNDPTDTVVFAILVGQVADAVMGVVGDE
jgi:hypothetical protein